MKTGRSAGSICTNPCWSTDRNPRSGQIIIICHLWASTWMLPWAYTDWTLNRKSHRNRNWISKTIAITGTVSTTDSVKCNVALAVDRHRVLARTWNSEYFNPRGTSKRKWRSSMDQVNTSRQLITETSVSRRSLLHLFGD